MLSCLGEWNTVSAASILFPWMPPVHLIFLKICLNTVDYHCPPENLRIAESTGLTYPQIRFGNNPPLLSFRGPDTRSRNTQTHTYARACVHACGNVLTLRLICPYDATQRLMVLCNPACFNVFWGAQTCCIYRENSHRSHSLTGCRWGRFPSQW